MPAERNPSVIALVEEQFRMNPDASVREIHTLAAELDPTIADLSARQFHGRYTLPVMRRTANRKKAPSRSRAKRKGARGAKALQSGKQEQGVSRDGAVSREKVRAVLLDFAQELAQAETRSEIVAALSRVDHHVDRVVEL